MAQLKKTVLGKVSGAVGDIVFRQRDGLNYIGLRPGSFTPGTNPASVARRARFALAAKASVSVNRIPALKSLWAGVLTNGISPYNYIFKQTTSMLPLPQYRTCLRSCLIMALGLQ